MTRSQFLKLMAAGVFGMALSACSSFAPVYGDVSANGASAIAFNFAPPQTRLEQVILNRLSLAFPGPASPTDPVLTITASTGGTSAPLSDTFEARRPIAVRIEATVSVVQGETLVFEATRFADTSYQDGDLTLTDRESATGANEVAARAVAESLRAAILAGYRPGAISTPRR
jgi:hypothetical protein